MAKAWKPWRPVPLKADELRALERDLRDRHVHYYACTVYSRQRQGAPDLLIPSLAAAIWLYAGREISPRQGREQATMRGLGWKILLPETRKQAWKLLEPMLQHARGNK